MARVLTLGAEEGTVGAQKAFATVDGRPVQIGGAASMGFVVPRTGDLCYRCQGNGRIAYAGLTDAQEACAGFAIHPTSQNSSQIYFTFANAKVCLFVAAGPTLTLKRDTTTLATGGSITLNAWQYIEVYAKCADSGGVCTVRINGTIVINHSGDTNGGAAGNTQLGALEFYGHTYSTTYQDCFYDDIVVNSVGGDANNSWPGQPRLWPLRIRGAGDHADLSRGGVDLGRNHAQVRDAGSLTSWLEGVTVDDCDLAAVDAPDLPAGCVINNVIVSQIVRAQAGGRKVKAGVKSVSTDNWAGAVQPGIAWTGVQAAWPVNPADSAAWEEADLASLQVGAKVAAP